MMPWPADLATLQRVCDVMRSGGRVGVATDGGWDMLASGLNPAAVAALPGDLAVFLASPNEVFDWAPNIRGAALRLIRDYWPGPMVVVNDMGMESGLAKWLPDETRRRVTRSEGLALRLTPHDSLTALATALGGPLVITSCDEEAPADVHLAVESVESEFSMTEVATGPRSARVVKPGSIRDDDIAASAKCRIVFVCTGNTCRSPMAGVLCRRQLADTLEVSVSELADQGFEIESAGLAAAPDQPASPEAVAVARSHGADLTEHRSRPLTMAMIDRADFLFTMTAGHLRMLQSLQLPVGPEPELLSAWDEDVPDPIGGPMELYQACAEQILENLRARLPRILEG